MHVRIGSKLYEGIDKLSTSKLKHLSFLAEQEILAYQARFSHPLKPHQRQSLEKLKTNKSKIDELLAESVS